MKTSYSIPPPTPPDAEDLEGLQRSFREAAFELWSSIGVPPPLLREIQEKPEEDAKKLYLSMQMLEVLKTATAQDRLCEFLKTKADWNPSGFGSHAPHPSFHREAPVFLDEIAMWTRKSLEALLELICFQATPDESHFRIYLHARRVHEMIHEESDLKEYWGIDEGRNRTFIDLHFQEMRRLWKKCGSRDLWFLSAPTNKALSNPTATLRTRRVFTTTAERFAVAYSQSSASERTALGLSYHRLFGLVSEKVHLNIGGHEPRWILGELCKSLSRLRGLAHHIVFRVQDSSGLAAGPQVTTLKSAPESNEVPWSDVEVGDLVVAGSDPGIVKKPERSSSHQLPIALIEWYLRDGTRRTECLPRPEFNVFLSRARPEEFLTGPYCDHLVNAGHLTREDCLLRGEALYERLRDAILDAFRKNTIVSFRQ